MEGTFRHEDSRKAAQGDTKRRRVAFELLEILLIKANPILGALALRR